ncbi:hypothetical protein I1A62_13600 [Rhodococcus sp. USK10]|uniref:hypothetical protein n=1 Tax=Rhodococcus sp. USK10 TaxID=2789739 RepID=UPI001C607EE0|nr:hypothetical protein [Rhodococcus sp. USK10]QYB05415.1 hypothetical protein I1A62_13600 [Rhodococcus sp. USK10]
MENIENVGVQVHALEDSIDQNPRNLGKRPFPLVSPYLTAPSMSSAVSIEAWRTWRKCRFRAVTFIQASSRPLAAFPFEHVGWFRHARKRGS